MSTHRLAPLAIAILIAASPGIAQEIGDTQIFTVISATPGLGDPPTQWASDVTVHNTTDGMIMVGFQYFPENQANTLDETFTGPRSFVINLGPRATRTVTNIVRNGFGITTSTKGMLLVSASQSFFPSNPERAELVATSRTYNTGSAAGTYGQTVPPNIEVVNVFATPSLVTGAREDSLFRSNLGIASLAMGGPITVHYRVLGPGGAVLAEGSRVVPALSMRQWSFANLGVQPGARPLTVELRLDPDDVSPDPCSITSQGGIPNAFFGYVSKVDGNPEGTGDAEYITAIPTDILDCPGD